MEVKEQGFDKQGLLTLFNVGTSKNNVKFGTVCIPPGDRVPAQGLSAHSENEYAIIIKGRLEGVSGGKRFEVKESNATFIPAGEQHWAVNTSDIPCEIVWMLVEEQ